ncbi:MAG: hypothetical protein K6B41_12490 [Butyrivibrio sp.]|nr:hypothetical protein [Butyrivibrio sp.]
MSTLYLHIGMPKTGTTSLQHFLTDNRYRLRRQDLEVPQFGLDQKGAGPGRNAHWMTAYYDDEKNCNDCYTLLGKRLKKYGRVVITDEGIYNDLFDKPDMISRLKKKTDEFGADLKIIMYVRRQDNYIYSAWSQRAKMRYTETLDDLLGRESYYKRMDYLDILNRISNIVGDENIIVRVYESGKFEGNGNSIFSDFLKIFNIEFTDEFELPEKEFNTSLHDVVLETKRRLNEYPEFRAMWNFNDILRYAEQCVKEEGKLKNRPSFSTEKRQEFMSRFDAQNAEIAKRFMHYPEGQPLFDEPIKGIDGESDEFTEEEIFYVMTRIILGQQIKYKEEYDLKLYHQQHDYMFRLKRKIGNITARFKK